MGKISMTMDMWTDSNLTPFMAVTAHWIEGTTEQTVNGPKLGLKLHADLISFQCMPGHHDGEHLTHAFLFITDRLKITEKVVVYTHITNILIFAQIWSDRVDNTR
jgi:hypothetical protein